MLKVELIGHSSLVARFRAMPSALRAALIRKTNALSLMLEAKVKVKLSGQVLNVVTGALRRSIQREVTVSDTQVKGKVYSAGDVKYAGIHEFGGVIKHPGGTPYMNFNGKTYWVSKMKAQNLNLPVTKAHAIPVPERSYMRSSLREMKDTIEKGYRDVVIQTAAGKGPNQ